MKKITNNNGKSLLIIETIDHRKFLFLDDGSKNMIFNFDDDKQIDKLIKQLKKLKLNR